MSETGSRQRRKRRKIFIAETDDEDEDGAVAPAESETSAFSLEREREEVGARLGYDVESKIRFEGFAQKLDETIERLEGKDFDARYLHEHGFKKPIHFDKMDDLGLVVPSADSFGVSDVRRLVGADRVIDVVDVRTQRGFQMTLGEFVDYFQHPERRKLLNVLSLEFSKTKLAEYVRAPSVVRELDWVELAWPRQLREQQIDSTNALNAMKYPKVQNYCLMSVAGCYTDFHVDFGGTSVWYHILRGEKIFWLVPPSDQNCQRFQAWTLSGRQHKTFFGDIAENCVRIKLKVGETFMIPSGWFHAVYTPVDSLVFGGNFLHSFAIPMQLSVYEIERNTHVPTKFRYPFFLQMQWYVLERYYAALTGQRFVRGAGGVEDVETAELKTDRAAYLSTAELEGLNVLVNWLQSLPASKRRVPDLIHQPTVLLDRFQDLLPRLTTVQRQSASVGTYFTVLSLDTPQVDTKVDEKVELDQRISSVSSAVPSSMNASPQITILVKCSKIEPAEAITSPAIGQGTSASFTVLPPDKVPIIGAECTVASDGEDACVENVAATNGKIVTDIAGRDQRWSASPSATVPVDVMRCVMSPGQLFTFAGMFRRPNLTWFGLIVCGVLLVPLWCRLWPKWCNRRLYTICGVKLPTDSALDKENVARLELAARVLANVSLGGSKETGDVQFAVIARRRPYPTDLRYLTQVVAGLLSVAGANLFVCNVDTEPNQFMEAIDLAKHVRVINRHPGQPGRPSHSDHRSSTVNPDELFESEKADYSFCLRRAVEMAPEDGFVVMFQDDALPVDGFVDMLRSIIDQIRRRHKRHWEYYGRSETSLFVKLYHPEKYRKLPWLVLVMAYSVASALLCTFLASHPSLTIFIRTFYFTGCLLWCLGHESVAYSRYLFTGRGVYLVSQESCCIPAVLYTGPGAVAVADYLDEMRAHREYTVDHMLDVTNVAVGLMTDRNLIRHIGRYTTLRMYPVASDPW